MELKLLRMDQRICPFNRADSLDYLVLVVDYD